MKKYLFLIFISTFIANNVHAADIWTHMAKSGRMGFVVIEGEVEPGDFKKFQSAVFDGNGKITGIYVYSSGGDFYEAMKIGIAVRELGLSSGVPMKEVDDTPFCPEDTLGVTPSPRNPKNCICASAGFFIHVAGVHRSGNYLAVHRPFFKKGRYGKLSETEAKSLYSKLQSDARSYMESMDIPLHVQEDVMSTSSDEVLVLNEDIVKKYFWGALPYRDEWLRNKCSLMSLNERIVLKKYAKRMMTFARKYGSSNISSHRDMGFTDVEWNEYLKFRDKEDEEIKCKSGGEKIARKIAFEKYFDIKINKH